MKNKDWITQLKSKMAAHQEEVPSELWDEIEQSLPVAPKSRPTLFRPIRRYAAAAAVAALIGGTVVLWHPWTDNTPLALSTTSQPTDITSPVSTGQESTSSYPEQTGPTVEDTPGAGSLSITSGTRPVSFNKPTTAPQSSDMNPQGMMSEPAKSASVEQVAVDEPKPSQESEKSATPAPQKAESVQPRQSMPINERESQILQALESGMISKEKRHGNAMGLYAQNDLATIIHREATGNYAMANAALFNGDDEHNDMMSPRYSNKTKHHRPYSFGLNFQYPLAKRLSLQTGLVYTQVRSDFTTESPAKVEKCEQVLHYVGIPVSLMYTLWQAGHFSVYVNGGGQADLNVKATVKSEGVKKDIDKDHMQFSALFGLGGQYQITPFMGVYVEPSMRYYFDNGSNVENIFKEDLWKFGFHLGFRFNVP